MSTLSHLITHRNADRIIAVTPDDRPAGSITCNLNGADGPTTWTAAPPAGGNFGALEFRSILAAEYYLLAVATEADHA